MKKVTLAIALAALVLFAGCNKDKETNGTTLKASIEQNQGDGNKTSLNPANGAISWTAGDQILVSNGDIPVQFNLKGDGGSTNGEFTYSGEFEIGTETKAVYPKADFVNFDGVNLSVTLPAEQTLTSLSEIGSFANGTNPMLGVYNGDGLTFTSLCGVLGLSLRAENADEIVPITAIEIVSNNPADKLNGTYSCTTANPELTYTGTDGTNRIRLECPAGTALTSTPKEFYIVLPAGTLADASGFTLNLYNGAADPFYSRVRASALPMEANWVKKMSVLDVPGVTGNIVMERKYWVHHALTYGKYYCYPSISFVFNNEQSLSIGYYNAQYWHDSWNESVEGVHIISRSKEWYIAPVSVDAWVKEKIIINIANGNVKYYMNDVYMGEESFSAQLDLENINTVEVVMNPYGWWTGHYTYVDDFSLQTLSTSISDNFDDGVIDLNIWKAPANPSGVYEQDGKLQLHQNVTDADFRLYSNPISLY